MKHIALTCLAALALAACAAPAADTTPDTAQSLDAKPLGAEPQGKDAKSGGKNTYVQGGCEKQLTRELAAIAAPEGWQARAITAAAENEAAGLEPSLNGTPPIVRTVAQAGLPMPVKGNYRCNMMFDLNAGGEPVNVMSHCTDPAFAAYAVSELQSLRFQPAMRNGAEVVRKGVVTDITVCTTN